MVGEGAVLYSKNEEQLNDLKQVRADTKTELPEISSALAYQRQPQMRDLPDGSEYTELLDKSQKTGIIGYAGNTPLSTYLIRVNNAKLILTHFAQMGIQMSYGSIPVYKYPIARKRWVQEPNYPVAEQVFNQLVLLPNHEGVKKDKVLEAIWKLVT